MQVFGYNIGAEEILVIVGVIAFLVISIPYLFPSQDAIEGGVLAPNFTLTDINGDTLRLQEYRGRIVVLNFMATWCGYCHRQIPELYTVYELYENQTVIISIDKDPTENEAHLRQLLLDYPYATWYWARDTANLAATFRVSAIPVTVIIDKEGYIQFIHVGLTSASTFISEIDQLLLGE